MVSNPGTTQVTGWSITFDLPAGVTASAAQNGSLNQSGRQVTLSPAHYNTTVAARGTTEPYSPAFTLSSASAEPENCRINDVRCDGAADTPPGAPGNLRSPVKTTKTVSLTWDASTDNKGIAGYEVYTGAALAATVTGTSATVSGLSPSTEYTFTVKARDLYDNMSAASTALKVSTDGHHRQRIRQDRLLRPVGHLRPPVLRAQPGHDRCRREADPPQLRLRQHRPGEPDVPAGRHQGHRGQPAGPEPGRPPAMRTPTTAGR
ncbi:cellulose binding domain-containing protein [Streptosporangium sp. NBC_01755]|uniref:fibronectin type III domain-containing protein n=1 Tax=unclassified Streptosporangium TaxID=2632669 RepID=UPI002DD9CC4F|nr:MULTISPECIES: cellulose binding domain-containing protein [unclassified Streptosporangium]WSA23521.1 cellulose binding domain-containing protein [Streptosporangium sp. NBC_01810]WSC98270.1 cellulose binding domain-containing protein [Streptosporangium sp. NBC_01755]